MDSGKSTKAAIKVKLRDGDNALKIIEENCSGGVVNVSLILGGKLVY